MSQDTSQAKPSGPVSYRERIYRNQVRDLQEGDPRTNPKGSYLCHQGLRAGQAAGSGTLCPFFCSGLQRVGEPGKVDNRRESNLLLLCDVTDLLASLLQTSNRTDDKRMEQSPRLWHRGSLVGRRG